MKRPKIDEEVAELVQKYANEHFDGNFTAAVNYLLMKCINNEEQREQKEFEAASDAERVALGWGVPEFLTDRLYRRGFSDEEGK